MASWASHSRSGAASIKGAVSISRHTTAPVSHAGAVFSSLLFTLLLSGAAAQAPSTPPTAPDTVTVVVENYQDLSGGSGDHFAAANATIRWRLSSNDPDQVNGDYNYSLFVRTEFSTFHLNVTPVAVANRPGWVEYTYFVCNCGVGPFQPLQNDTIAIRPWADSETTYGASCDVKFDWRYPVTYSGVRELSWDHCGEDSEPPRGIAGRVTQLATEGDYTRNLTWTAPSDASATIVYRYCLGLDFDLPNGRRVVDFAAFTVTNAGLCEHLTTLDNEQITSDGPNTLTFRVYAYDNETGTLSPASCQITLDLSRAPTTDSCGFVAAYGLGALPGVSGPSFPLINVPSLAEDLETDVTTTGWLLGFVLLVGGILIGFAAGPTGGLAGGAIGILFSVILGLIPIWFIVVAFIAMVGVAAALFFSGSK